MPVITLISDTGASGYYAAVIKASILSGLPTASIVDITHNIEPFNILDAAFVLRNAYRSFAPGTVHLVAVDAPAGGEKHFVALSSGGHYFVGIDNGVFSLALAGMEVKAVEISSSPVDRGGLFPAAGILAKAASRLAAGEPPEAIGKEFAALKRLEALQPTYNSDQITTQIVYTDSYGNCFCNLDKSLFLEVAAGRRFLIDIKGYTIETISDNYDQVQSGDLLAIFSDSGLLKIAQSYGNIAQILGLKKDDRIMITFNV